MWNYCLSRGTESVHKPKQLLWHLVLVPKLWFLLILSFHPHPSSFLLSPLCSPPDPPPPAANFLIGCLLHLQWLPTPVINYSCSAYHLHFLISKCQIVLAMLTLQWIYFICICWVMHLGRVFLKQVLLLTETKISYSFTGFLCVTTQKERSNISQTQYFCCWLWAGWGLDAHRRGLSSVHFSVVSCRTWDDKMSICWAWARNWLRIKS